MVKIPHRLTLKSDNILGLEPERLVGTVERRAKGMVTRIERLRPEYTRQSLDDAFQIRRDYGELRLLTGLLEDRSKPY